jgi:hypothetical protein
MAPPHASRPLPSLQLLLLALLLCLVFGQEIVRRYETLPTQSRAPSPTFLYGDGPFFRGAIQALLSRGDLDLKDQFFTPRCCPPWYRPEHNISLGLGGQWYPKHTLLLPLLSLPFYAALGDAGLLLCNMLLVVALGLLVFQLAQTTAGHQAALATTLWFACGTMLRPLAYNYSSDPLSSLLVLAGVVAALQQRGMLAGVLLGLSIPAKWSNAVLIPGVLGWLAWQRQWPLLRRLALGLAGPCAAVALLNTAMFGAPWVTPYDRVIDTISGSEVTLEALSLSSFHSPFLPGLWEQLTNRFRGLLVSAPPVVLAVPGILWLRQRGDARWALWSVLMLTQILFFAPYSMWRDSNVGHRFLLTAALCSAAPTAEALRRLLSRLGTDPGSG